MIIAMSWKKNVLFLFCVELYKRTTVANRGSQEREAGERGGPVI